jgi:Ca-activated chloride channel family protein
MDEALLSLEGSVDRDAIERERDATAFVLVRVAAKAPAVDKVRPPLSVVFAIDASGSMQGPPLEHALASVESMLSLLGDDDAVGVVAFSDEAAEVMPSTAIGAGARRLARGRLPRVVADGYTNIESALRLGATMLGPRAPNARHAVILLSDGAPNRGAATPDALRDLARELHAELAVSTLGYGDRHNEDVLAAVADGGGGLYAYVPDPVTATSDFARVLGAQGDVVADGLTLVLAPREGVEIVRVVGRTDTRFGAKGLAVPLGDAREGGTQYVALEVRVRGRREGGAMPLVGLELAFHAPHAAAAQTLSAEASVDVGSMAGEPRPEVVARVLLVRSQEERSKARALADRHQFEGAAAHLRVFLKEIEAAPGYVSGDGSELSEAYEQLLDEAMAYERKPSAEQYAHFRRAQRQSSLAASDGLVASYAASHGAYGRVAIAKSAGDVPEAYLHIIRGANVGMRVRLGVQNTIGRTASADVVISSQSVSRRHAEVIAQNGRFWLRDLGSTNATLVNGEPVAQQSVPLSPGDVITVGQVELAFVGADSK